MPEKLDSSLHVKIDARRTDSDAKPYGFKVEWIPWDSGFRGTDLRQDDVITAIGDKVFTPEKKDFDFGQYSEEKHWESLGAADDTPVTLTVVRGGTTLKITGKVRADRFYTNDQGKRTIGLDGPEERADDGFGKTWTFWLEDAQKAIADATYAVYHLNTRQYLDNLEGHRERIEFLAKKFPKSAFARAMKEDFDRAIDTIKGRKYDLTADDLAYRSLSSRRVEKAAERSAKERDAFLAKAGAVPLESLPAVDPVRGKERKALAGKAVVLPKLVDEISEAGHGWYAPRGAGGSVFLVDTNAPAFVAIFRAMERYKQRIGPVINEIFEMIGRVTDRPAMVAAGNKVYTGLVVEPIAAMVDGKMFVDVSSGSIDAPFAGESEFVKPPTVDTRKDLTASETFRACMNAVKLGDFDLWQTFYAPWECAPTGIGDDYAFDPENGPLALRSFKMFYEHARQVLLQEVYDMRVLTESAPKLVYDKNGTRVETVELDVDPVGLFDGEYRSFRSVNVHRIWHLQRINGGPWKIVSEQGL